MGEVIVIEGSGRGGKATQTALLYEHLKAAGRQVWTVTCLNYDSPSSSLMKMYLGKELGDDAFTINAYVASSFFMMDRSASYIKDWKELYEAGENNIVICDRYVISNMLHQTTKIEGREEKLKSLGWEYDFESVKGGFPVPDKAFFLDVNPDTTSRLMRDRENKFIHEAEKDIHGSNPGFLIKSYENSLLFGERYGWDRIPCCDEEGRMKSTEAIHEIICQHLDDQLFYTES